MPEKVCSSCGQPLSIGYANCPFCGARVGTVFSPSGRLVDPTKPAKSRKVAEPASPFYAIDKARSQANNSLILSLAGFFCPGAGFLMGAVAILLGFMARKALVKANVEEGRGTATAGIIIGAISLLAQTSYAIYFLNAGFF
jgi:uncharacterized Zn finger protein (UPF0148 family)